MARPIPDVVLIEIPCIRLSINGTPLSPEFEAELKQAALERGRSVDQLVQEVVEIYLDHGTWF